eukprot:5942373-Prorocentrum_lima.AAC.1
MHIPIIWLAIPLDKELSTWVDVVHCFFTAQCERSWVALAAHPWHSPLRRHNWITGLLQEHSLHVHKISLRAKNRKDIWKRHTIGPLPTRPTNALAQLKRRYYPSNFVLEESSQFYYFPTCLSEQLYIHVMESSGIFYKGEESLKAPTRTLFVDDILRPLDSDDLRLFMDI